MASQNLVILETTNSEQINIFKALAKALKVKFEIKEKDYNPEFVEKINKSKEQVKNGQVTRVNKENLKEFLGI